MTAKLAAADLAAVGPSHVDPNFIGLARPVLRHADVRSSDRSRPGPARPARRRMGGIPVRADRLRRVAGGRRATSRPRWRRAIATAAGTKWRRSSAIPPECRARWPCRCRHSRRAQRRCGSVPHRRSIGIESRSCMRSRCLMCDATCCRCARRGSNPTASRGGPPARSVRRITTMARARRSATRGTSAVGTPNSAASIRSWPTRITRWRSSVRAKRSSSTSRRRPRLRRRGGRAVSCSNFAAGARTWISTRSTARPSSRCPGTNTAARARLHPRFNTRYASGF